MIELSIEQQFQIAAFKQQVEEMTLEQAQAFLIMLHEQMIIKEEAYTQLLKHEWGIEVAYIEDSE
ncbi:MAG: NblA/ycf18 family protein [Sphaerospermopsis kisseleviana]